MFKYHKDFQKADIIWNNKKYLQSIPHNWRNLQSGSLAFVALSETNILDNHETSKLSLSPSRQPGHGWRNNRGHGIKDTWIGSLALATNITDGQGVMAKWCPAPKLSIESGLTVDGQHKMWEMAIWAGQKSLLKFVNFSFSLNYTLPMASQRNNAKWSRKTTGLEFLGVFWRMRIVDVSRVSPGAGQEASEHERKQEKQEVPLLWRPNELAGGERRRRAENALVQMQKCML